jgi:hypothetical protein
MTSQNSTRYSAEILGSPLGTDEEELCMLKSMSFLREALWAASQTVEAETAFDSRASEIGFRPYRQARPL